MNAQGRTIRCAIYTRKSSEEGLEQDYNSLHAQRDACAAYVLSQAGEGWTLSPEVYDDGGFSGGNMDRPALKRLLADIEAGKVDVVVVYKVDRLTRALADFSKIVEVLDRTGASFVSVTQAFNTTTSMGRLTLNVLLSFAQFEREVTGERIRDKIAASKKLGMWMGGCPVLGYDPKGRTLVVNPAEAEVVRTIFNRYLELESVHALARHLTALGVVSKRWTSKSGEVRGGVPIQRGALYHLLRNPIYIGRIRHKGRDYPGQHPAILDEDLFEAVQLKLDETAERPRAKNPQPRVHRRAPLAGLIYDSAGNLMSPVSVARKGGATYRYYVSTVLQKGVRNQAGVRPRITAPMTEEAVAGAVTGLMGSGPPAEGVDWTSLRTWIERVEVLREEVVVHLAEAQLQSLEIAQTQVRLDHLERVEGRPVLRETIRQGSRGVVVAIGPRGGEAWQRRTIDPVLTSALIRAESWKRRLMSGEEPTLEAIAAKEGVTSSYASRVLRAAFLAPDLKAAILDGRQPSGLTLQAIMSADVPLDWNEQRRRYAA